jgi:hypothetical protein
VPYLAQDCRCRGAAARDRSILHAQDFDRAVVRMTLAASAHAAVCNNSKRRRCQRVAATMRKRDAAMQASLKFSSRVRQVVKA